MSTHRTHLTANQEYYLKLLFKFRFITIPLLSQYRNTKEITAKRTLDKLIDRGLVLRRYEPSYKLQGKAASYCLSKTGIAYCKDKLSLNPRVLHVHYKNPYVSEAFVDKSLLILKTFIKLQVQYPDEFNVFTSYELHDYDDTFPAPLPSLYLSRKNPKNQTNTYLLDVITNQQPFVIKKRINALIEHYESGDWPGEIYPTVLLVLDDARIERSTKGYVEQAKDSNFIEDSDFQVLTTTIRALLSGQSKHVWSLPEDETKSVSLSM